MPTIRQLPTAPTINDSDALPLAQGGTTRSATVGQLLAGIQKNIIAVPGKLLGRFSQQSGSPEPISIGQGLLFSSDGTTLLTNAEQPGSRPYDFQIFRYRMPAFPEPIVSLVMARQVVFPVGLALSRASAKDAPTNAVSMQIMKNGSQIGSIQFAAGSGSGTFVFNSLATYVAGDEIELYPPQVIDPTFNRFRAVLVGYR